MQAKAAVSAHAYVSDHRPVPFEGPPRLDVALELLERAEAALAPGAPASDHVRRALTEVRSALTRR